MPLKKSLNSGSLQEIMLKPMSVNNSNRELDENVTEIKRPTRRSGIYAWIPARHILTFLSFWGFFLVYALRVNLSVAIVAMVNHRNKSSNGGSEIYECQNFNDSIGNSSDIQKAGEFNWDEKTQGLILGAFFYGYVITQIPGGRMAELFGAKWLLGLGILCTSVFTLLMPMAARWNFSALIATRVLAGLGEGVTFPALYALYAKWMPVQEQSLQLGLSGNGATIGTVVTLPVAAMLCELDYDNGWPLVFYLFGGLGCMWFVFWAFIVTSTPEEHSKITYEELRYIQHNRQSSTLRNQAPTPWIEIFTSGPVWVLAFTKFAGAWAFYTVLTEIPNYMESILHFSILKNGWQNSLLYVAQFITIIIASAVADHLRSLNYFSITTIRKVIQLTANLGCAICLACISAMGCDRFSIVLLLVAAMAILGFSAGGEGPLALDIAPNHAGTVCGLTNGFSNFAGILAPLITGVLTNNNETMQSWGLVFYISSAMNVLGALIFLIGGTAEIQPWSDATQYSLVENADLSNEEDNEG